MSSTYINYNALAALPQGNFKAGRRAGVQPGRRAAGAVPAETAAQHVGNHAAVHALQGGPGEHGQRGEPPPTANQSHKNRRK